MIEVLTNIGLLAGALLGLSVIWRKGLKPIYRLLKRVEEVHEIILEFPEWKDRVDGGLNQLYPNSGSSIHDKVTSTNRIVNETKKELDGLKALVQTHIDNPSAHND